MSNREIELLNISRITFEVVELTLQYYILCISAVSGAGDQRTGNEHYKIHTARRTYPPSPKFRRHVI